MKSVLLSAIYASCDVNSYYEGRPGPRGKYLKGVQKASIAVITIITKENMAILIIKVIMLFILVILLQKLEKVQQVLKSLLEK